MNPRELMVLGASVGGVFVLIDIVVSGPPVGIVLFAGGMLFGKGYGLYEERSRK